MLRLRETSRGPGEGATTILRAVLADDEPTSLALLRDLLESSGRVAVVGEATDGRQCIEVVERTKPDALFVDIEMPGANGLEVAEELLKRDSAPLLAFVTGHDEYALKAFDVAALDYVVKDLDLTAFERRLSATLDRMERARGQPAAVVDDLRARLTEVQRALSAISAPPSRAFGTKLPVKDYEEGTVRLIDTDSIIYAERKERRVVLHTRTRSYPTYYTVERLEKRLAPSGFVRANQGTLVNLNYIEHLIPNGDGSYDLVLREPKQTVVTASRSRAKDLLQRIQP